MGWIIHVDGGSRGNPGPAGAGVVIRDDDEQLIHEGGYFLGRQTNNAAEYNALIIALKRAAAAGNPPLRVRSDSELLVRQMTGEYRVKSPTLEQLFHEAQLLLLKVPRWHFQHVRREENQRADKLANLAMDEERDVIVFDIAGESAASAAKASTKSAVDVPPKKTHRRKPPAAGPPTAIDARRLVQVCASQQPAPDMCPLGEASRDVVTIDMSLPDGLCIYAAHAILPTLLGMKGTDPGEFASVPTMTVRCTRPGCGAAFTLSPARPPNGTPRKS